MIYFRGHEKAFFKPPFCGSRWPIEGGHKKLLLPEVTKRPFLNRRFAATDGLSRVVVKRVLFEAKKCLL